MFKTQQFRASKIRASDMQPQIITIRKTSADKTQAKLSVLPDWIMLQLSKWLDDKPTGMATITIEVHANQGGIGGISRGFAIKEGM